MLNLIFREICKVLSFIPVFIYNTFYSQFYTKWTYHIMAARLNQKSKITKILDVGVGTGHALKEIMHKFPEEVQIVGIDIDDNFVRHAKKIFKKSQNVQIRQQDFYDLENQKESYDIVIFSSSFMVLQDQKRALEIAKKLINKQGSIIFLLTLENDLLSLRTLLLEKVKPFLKYLTTINFGRITYEYQFCRMLENNDLKIIYKQQVPIKNIFLYFFRMFVIETLKIEEEF